jgi:hypothetical protein
VGANIDYYLANEPSDDLRLEILDAEGNLLREYSSVAEKAGEPEDEETMREPQVRRAGMSRLPKEAGMHRFVWDLRFAGPVSGSSDRSETRGPMVPPGTYQARLSVGDWSDTRSIEVKMDPRVVAEGITPAIVADQTKLALKVRDDLNSARRAAARLEKAEKEASESTAEALAKIRKQLVTEPIRYSQPMLTDQLEYLYSNLIRADQVPGQDAYERHEELSTALRDHLQALEQALGSE